MAINVVVDMAAETAKEFRDESRRFRDLAAKRGWPLWVESYNNRIGTLNKIIAQAERQEQAARGDVLAQLRKAKVIL